MMIEAFDEVMNDAKAVEDCKVWLLKQKQTQDWKTTKATADAVYALLLRGENLLASDELVEVTLGGIGRFIREKVEAGTGFYEQRFLRERDQAQAGRHHGEEGGSGRGLGQRPLAIPGRHEQGHALRGHAAEAEEDALHRPIHAKGPVLEPVKGPLSVGDELVVRIELRMDRDMEYVHLKDQRGSGTEPVNVLSRYKYQDGLAYYESPATPPATSSSTTCRRAPTSSSIRPASVRGRSTRRAWPRSSACTPRSSTATRRASPWWCNERKTLSVIARSSDRATTVVRSSIPSISRIRAARSSVTPWYSFRSSRETWDSWTPSFSASCR